MGKAKIKLQLIEKEKSRAIIFKKRKQGLLKKLEQLSVLCGVPACAIIYGPGGAIEPEIWPQRRNEVVGLIDMYNLERGKHCGGKRRRYGVKDYFDGRKKSVEDEVMKLRKNKYPTDLQIFNSMSEGELRQFAEALGRKGECLRSKIQILKEKGLVMDAAAKHYNFGNTGELNVNAQFYPPLAPINYHHNQNMMLLTNGGDGDDQCDGFNSYDIMGATPTHPRINMATTDSYLYNNNTMDHPYLPAENIISNSSSYPNSESEEDLLIHNLSFPYLPAQNMMSNSCCSSSSEDLLIHHLSFPYLPAENMMSNSCCTEDLLIHHPSFPYLPAENMIPNSEPEEELLIHQLAALDSPPNYLDCAAGFSDAPPNYLDCAAGFSDAPPNYFSPDHHHLMMPSLLYVA